ncbi:MAG: polysaccharide deacetylase family protein [bacterium]|nr:polysaccharide deacetylase family protein [bacterium]
MAKTEQYRKIISLVIFTLGGAFLFALPVHAQTVGPNLIGNPSFKSSPISPTGWSKGGYGNNTRVFSYPVTGYDDAYAAKVSITTYTGGDAKWFFGDVAVQSGHTYQFSDYFQSNVPSIITARYALSGGGYMYKDILLLSPNSAYQNATIKFIVPQNAVSLTIFHLINQVGVLTTDDYSLNEITPPLPTGPPNLILNPDLESSDVPNKPAYWNSGSWGSSTRTFTYPVPGVSGSRAAQVAITNYTSGDAKWYFTPRALSPGVYVYSDQYISTATSKLTVQYQYTDGTFFYVDLKILPPTNVFTAASAQLSVPANVSTVTVFHLIAEVGTLTIDNTSLQLLSTPKGIFTTGAVSLTFDDGTLSQYENAIPKLNSSGLKGVFYIVSQRLSNYGYPGFMSIAQVIDIYNNGHEIGAHTRTHAHLPSLTLAQQQSEIQGSRQDLLAFNVGPILSFAYPYGEHNDAVVGIVKNAGLANARGTGKYYAQQTENPFTLPRMGVEVNTTVADVKTWIDTALANKEWLILGFHQIDTSGEQYSTTPDTFNQIIDYLIQKNAPVITIEQGVKDLL